MTNTISIEVFKTNIEHPTHAAIVIHSLQHIHPHWKVSIDLDDCDKVLRIAAANEIDVLWVSNYVSGLGYSAMLLD